MYGLSLADGLVSPQTASWIDIYAVAGIGVQNPFLARNPVLTRILFGEHTGVGIAKVSDAQMETPYGQPVYDEDGNIRGYGLGLRSPGESYPDQSDPQVAFQAMMRRIQLVTDACNQVCTSTDIFLAAALAENGPGFTHLNLRDLIGGTTYYDGQAASGDESPSLHWEQYLEHIAARDPKKARFLRKIIRQFANNVSELAGRGYSVPADLDWAYIDMLTKR